MNGRLAGTNVIITGAAVRLGKAMAVRLAGEGANVCVHYGHSNDEAEETLCLLQSSGIKAVCVQADLAEETPSAAARIFDAAEGEIGPVNLLVNSAAIFEPSTLREITEDDWDRHFSINLKAPTWLSKEFANRLPEESPGSIINIVDWRGLRPQPGHLAYTLTKSGLVSLTKLLAQELAPRVRVNAIAPGAILPPPGADEDHLTRLREKIPLRKTGRPDDITDAVVYLACAPYVTGQILSVTGGEEL